MQYNLILCEPIRKEQCTWAKQMCTFAIKLLRLLAITTSQSPLQDDKLLFKGGYHLKPGLIINTILSTFIDTNELLCKFHIALFCLRAHAP